MTEKEEIASATDFARSYVQRLKTILDRLDVESTAQVIELFLEARRRDATIFFLGNGGSAATACHFANDLSVSASPKGHRPFRALSLTANNALITCLANDNGYDDVFALQLRTIMRPGDVVVGISASGNSPNVVNALEYAEQNGAVSVAIVGFGGGKSKKIARYVIHVETERGEYGPCEDVHMILDHLVSAYLALVSQ